jgi:hypothetical protein
MFETVGDRRKQPHDFLRQQVQALAAHPNVPRGLVTTAGTTSLKLLSFSFGSVGSRLTSQVDSVG